MIPAFGHSSSSCDCLKTFSIAVHSGVMENMRHRRRENQLLLFRGCVCGNLIPLKKIEPGCSKEKDVVILVSVQQPSLVSGLCGT